jgi:hypothetical protein
MNSTARRKNMFKKHLMAAGIALVVSGAAHADYRWEIDATAGRSNIDIGRDDGDVDVFGIGGSFFLDDVDTSKGPLTEAAFLDQASSISAAYIYTDLDDIVDDLDGDEYRIEGRYVLGLDSVPLIFEGSYSRQEPDFSDIDTWTLGFGAYLTDTTTVVATFGNVDVDEGGDSDFYELSVRHLWNLSGGGAIALEGNYGSVDVDDADDVDVFNVEGVWYINKNLGIGARYGSFDSGGVETDDYAIFTEWFFTENFAVSAEYEYSEVDDTDIEIDSFFIGGRFRF